jgi:hypothetical protein
MFSRILAGVSRPRAGGGPAPPAPLSGARRGGDRGCRTYAAWTRAPPPRDDGPYHAALRINFGFLLALRLRGDASRSPSPSFRARRLPRPSNGGGRPTTAGGKPITRRRRHTDEKPASAAPRSAGALEQTYARLSSSPVVNDWRRHDTRRVSAAPDAWRSIHPRHCRARNWR